MRAIQVTIDGVTYPSQTAAAEALGVHVSAITKAKRRGTIARIGRGPYRAKPITVDGVSYPSMSAAYRETGIHRRDLAYLLKTGGAS